MERDSKSVETSDAYKISTHTLTWSVTRKADEMTQKAKNFNSHAHVERDLVG